MILLLNKLRQPALSFFGGLFFVSALLLLAVAASLLTDFLPADF